MRGSLALSGLWPPFRGAVLYYLGLPQAQALSLTIVQGYRSEMEQAEKYAQGRTPEEIRQRTPKHGHGGAVTDAPPGTSPHNYGLAIDIDGPDLQSARALWVAIGGGVVSWDLPHLEWPNWRALIGH